MSQMQVSRTQLEIPGPAPFNPGYPVGSTDATFPAFLATFLNDPP